MNTDKVLTVEEAAHNDYFTGCAASVGSSARSIYEQRKESFKSGVAWQKEQGWDWVAIKNGEPLPEVNEKVMVLLNGHTALTGKLMYATDKPTVWVVYYSDGEHIAPDEEVTHFCYINLPKP